MINQLKFYEIDETTIGTDTEEEDEMQQLQQQAEGIDTENMNKGVDEDEEGKSEKSAMEKFASGLDADYREKEMT